MNEQLENQNFGIKAILENVRSSLDKISRENLETFNREIQLMASNQTPRKTFTVENYLKHPVLPGKFTHWLSGCVVRNKHIARFAISHKLLNSFVYWADCQGYLSKLDADIDEINDVILADIRAEAEDDQDPTSSAFTTHIYLPQIEMFVIGSVRYETEKPKKEFNGLKNNATI